MKFTECRKDVFSVDPSYALAHCISADCALGVGAGIALQFQRRFKIREILKTKVSGEVGECVSVIKFAFDDCEKQYVILNLVTKRRYYQNTTYENLIKALLDMEKECRRLNITKIAMPHIGCGLDRLGKQGVIDCIHAVFDDTDFEILFCEWR